MSRADLLFDLSILDSYAADYAIALGRCGSDIAIRRIPFGSEFDRLADFSTQLFAVLRGVGLARRPTPEDIESFGRQLFDFVLRDDLLRLYAGLPQTHVTVNILTNHTKMRQLPWEYLQEPKCLCPRNGRSVVRLVPTIGLAPVKPLPKSSVTKVLFVAADPIGLRNVDWSDVKATIERTYAARMGGTRLELRVIDGSDRDSLVSALQTQLFDIVHFSCHGTVVKSMGRLILMDRKTNRPDFIDARELGRLLAGRNIRLVILSACETSANNFEGDFGNIAEMLVHNGIPAAVANQAPAKNKTTAAFAGALYKELLTSGNIDKAMTAGRIALSIELRGDPEWGIPTLHRLHGAEQLYE